MVNEFLAEERVMKNLDMMQMKNRLKSGIDLSRMYYLFVN